jgi:hypothetical protein
MRICVSQLQFTLVLDTQAMDSDDEPVLCEVDTWATMQPRQAKKYSVFWIALALDAPEDVPDRVSTKMVENHKVVIAGIGVKNVYVQDTEDTRTLVYVQCHLHREITHKAVWKAIKETDVREHIIDVGRIVSSAVPNQPMDRTLYGTVEKRIKGTAVAAIETEVAPTAAEIEAQTAGQLRSQVENLMRRNRDLQRQIDDLQNELQIQVDDDKRRELRALTAMYDDLIVPPRYDIEIVMTIVNDYWEQHGVVCGLPASDQAGKNAFFEAIDREYRTLLSRQTPRDTAVWCMRDMLSTLDTLQLDGSVTEPYRFRFCGSAHPDGVHLFKSTLTEEFEVHPNLFPELQKRFGLRWDLE